MQNQIIKTDIFSYNQAISLKNESIWKSLSEMPMHKTVENFLEKLSYHTKKSYNSAFNIFFENGFINPFWSIQEFSLCNMENILDKIKQEIKGSEATKQARCACFLSFTRYLSRKTEGIVRSAIPNKNSNSPTFRKIRSTSATKALNEKEMMIFFKSLKEYNYRDYLIAQMTLQGAKRIEEVLSSKIDQIDWQNKIIKFKQSKANEMEKFTFIHFPSFFLNELKQYIGTRLQSDFIFVTKLGKKVDKFQVYRSFLIASKRVNLLLNVTPHVLRASAITILAKKGFSAEQIMMITGHNSMDSVHYYDKTPMEENISREVSLIGVG